MYALKRHASCGKNRLTQHLQLYFTYYRQQQWTKIYINIILKYTMHSTGTTVDLYEQLITTARQHVDIVITCWQAPAPLQSQTLATHVQSFGCRERPGWVHCPRRDVSDISRGAVVGDCSWVMARFQPNELRICWAQEAIDACQIGW